MMPTPKNWKKLKILPEYFAAQLIGTKNFEIRKNDRDYKVGDYVCLSEWDKDEEEYTGRSILTVITYITDYKQRDGYVVFGKNNDKRDE
ncbi:DUF3850 domain-containing protein [Pediococcus inopinatus]|uniref:DUF3850 domain-containing protein n=1 Tax=Pediococcus inopinatus TaxID=114090 RepID=UPI002B26055B|nr:DUF3850 domain-containing protein [Pediococcus inopinatus]WPC19449.1 DUF3850 domain-containing protein [Pediococcus inopinatus]